MGLRIHTNVPALIAQRNLKNNRLHLDNSLERMSTGLKINHASDDAAGLALSEILRSQNRGLAQAEKNAQDGISVIQITEGSLNEISNILVRMRELCVQAASDTVGENERNFLNIEFQEMLSEINRIANTTEYNNFPLLSGNSRSFEIQIGTRNQPSFDRIQILDEKTTDVTTPALGIHLAKIDDKLSAQNSLDFIDKALKSIISMRSKLGAIQNRIQSTLNTISISKENITSAISRIKDMDMAEEMTELTKNNILMQSGVSILSQANSSIKTALDLLNTH